LFLSVVTVGELRRGVEIIRHRGDRQQADRLDAWLEMVLSDYAENILDFTSEAAQVWGRLRVPHYRERLGQADRRSGVDSRIDAGDPQRG